ncbi:hypothetical protein QYF61_008055 [Mycteria americana]|uniref:Uncharacterized protein n=1 Tax=Mycteria americana TaxID=33587 RepID=A0AAN7RZ83_MYCAM|nr:hypothetical protein QYF61_008055 [Mycteria americana]
MSAVLALPARSPPSLAESSRCRVFPPTGCPPPPRCSALLRHRATQALPLSPPLQKSHVPPLPQRGEEAESAKFLLLTLLSLAGIAGVLAASGVAYCLRHRAHHRLKEKLSALGTDAGSDAPAAYQVQTLWSFWILELRSVHPAQRSHTVGSERGEEWGMQCRFLSPSLCGQGRCAVLGSVLAEQVHVLPKASEVSASGISSPSCTGCCCFAELCSGSISEISEVADLALQNLSPTSLDKYELYRELCRQRMAVKTSDRPEPLHASRINSVSSQFSDGPIPSPSARSSTSSWCEEPVQSNMDISTGHMILSYMEDHLKNKNRLEKEWEALCAYQAEPNATTIAQQEENVQKNRSRAVAKQPQFPQLLLIRLVLQTLHQLRCASLGTLQHLNVSLVARGPKLNTVFEVWPHQCRVQVDNHFPSPAGHTVSDTSQDAIGFLGHLGTLLAHIQSAIDQYSQVLFRWAAFQPLFPKPVALHGVVVTQGQDPALGLVEPHTTGLSPSTQPVQIPLQSLPTLNQINSPAQLGVVCKLTEEALDPFIQIIDKDIKQNWLQY